MSADILRRAATLMRERAEAATPGPWTRDSGWSFTAPPPDSWGGSYVVAETRWRQDTDHLASMHPAVALAVADWLDVVAARYEAVLDTFAPGSRAGAATAAENVTGYTEALAVARAYLGDKS